MKTTSILFPIVAVVLIGIASPASAMDKPVNYLAVKGGLYSPSTSYDLNNVNGGNKIHLDSKTGLNGEVAVGHYFHPGFALEFGAGYFESEGSPAAQANDTKLRVVPVIATAKLLFPIGIFEPYGEFGIGTYFTKLAADGNTFAVDDSSDVTYGLHAGGGVNFNITERFFLGVEGRYLWAKPSFGGQDIDLNGFTLTGDLGFRF